MELEEKAEWKIELVEKAEWGWVKYHRLGWINEFGQKYYEATFRAEHDLMGWTETRIRFWANRPIIALRFICKGKKLVRDILAYNEKEIN